MVPFLRAPHRSRIFRGNRAFSWASRGAILPALAGLLLPTPLLAADPVVPAASDTVFVLDTIPVLGSRVRADLPVRTRSIQVLDRAALGTLPVRSVAEALRWATGVEVQARSFAQTDLSLRGGTFEQVLVLVDGVRMSDPQTGHFDLDLAVPLERIERIEVLRGPASAQYGSDAVGGVVNIVTRSAPSGGSLRVEGGSFGTLLAAADGSIEGGRLRMEGGTEVGRSDGHREGTEWEQALFSLRAEAPLAGGRLRGDLGYARRDFGAEGFYAPFPSVEATRTETAALRWAPAPTARVRVEPRITWRGHDDDFTLIRENPAVYRNLHRSTQAGADLVVRGSLAPWVQVATGAEVARHGLTSNALGNRREGRGAVFAEAAIAVTPRVDLSLGLRHDRYGPWGGFTSPSVAAAWTLGEAFTLRSSWGQSFRGPTWTERYYADPGHLPNPDVGPESGESREVGAAWAASSRVHLSAALWERRQRDLIDWARPLPPVGVVHLSTTPEPWVPRNVNRARFRGVETEVRVEADADTRLSTSLSLLSLRADSPPGLQSKYALRPLTEHLQVGLHRRLFGGETLGVWASVSVRHGRRAGEAGFRDLDLRLDLPVPGRAGGATGARIHLDARNLLDADHLDLTGNPVPGRSLSVGIRTGTR